MHWSGLNSDLKHFLKHIFQGGGGGADFSKIELRNKKNNFEKWSKIRNQI